MKLRIRISFVLCGNKVLFQITDRDQAPAQKLELGEVIAAVFRFQYIPDSGGRLLLCFCEKEEGPQTPLYDDSDSSWIFLGKIMGEEGNVEAGKLAWSSWRG